MKNTITILVIIATIFTNCNLDKKFGNSGNVGYISFSPKTDDPEFTLCKEKTIKSYDRLGGEPIRFEGEKLELERLIFSQYDIEELSGQDGYLTYRFIVNCQAKTDRFRYEGMDFEYKQKDFDDRITSKLLSILKKLDGWQVGIFAQTGRTHDYIQYLTFRLENAQIKFIRP